jgi:NADP-dependent 3-hydroxy acid dehydrogenase YdfG
VDVNIKGVLNGIAAVLPKMLERKSGDIVNISSDAGRKVFTGGSVYCGTKWAVEVRF